jgi:hypothetical protein
MHWFSPTKRRQRNRKAKSQFEHEGHEEHAVCDQKGHPFVAFVISVVSKN